MSYLKNNEDLADAIDDMEMSATMIGDIFFIPTLDADDVNDTILDMLMYMDDDNVELLEKQFPSFKLIKESYDNCANRHDRNDFYFNFVNDLKDNSENPFLVQIKVCESVSSVYIGADNDEITGWGGSWSSFSSTWILAYSMEHAIDQAITIGRERLRQNSNIKKS